jgi:hypothetical protein
VAPSANELVGRKRKAAHVLRDVNAFLALAGRLGVDGRDLFSTSDIVEGRNTPQVICMQMDADGNAPHADGLHVSCLV